MKNKTFTFQVIKHLTPWEEFKCEAHHKDRLRVFLDVTVGRDEAYEHYAHRVEEVRFALWKGGHVLMNKSKTQIFTQVMKGDSDRGLQINLYRAGFITTLSLKNHH